MSVANRIERGDAVRYAHHILQSTPRFGGIQWLPDWKRKGTI